MPARVIVPLDGSKFAEDALATALTLVDSGRLDLVTAIEGAPPFSVPEYDALARDWAMRYLDGVMEKLPPSVTVQPHVLVGVPTKEIAAFIDESEADLVVMATHGRGPVTRAWLGSMADYLIRTSTVPLLLLHLEKEEEPSYQAEAHDFKRVLIPLDGSELAESAIDGVREAFGPGVEVTLLRVVQYPYHFVSPYLPDTIQGNQELFRQATAQAKDYLTEAAWRLKDKVAGVETEVTVSEHPAHAIVDHAHADEFDCIAMATHGRSGLRRLALGSVADKVIRTSKIPVLTFRPAPTAGDAGALGVAEASRATSV